MSTEMGKNAGYYKSMNRKCVDRGKGIAMGVGGRQRRAGKGLSRRKGKSGQKGGWVCFTRRAKKGWG